MWTMLLIQKTLGRIQGRIEPFDHLPSMRKMTSRLQFHGKNDVTSAYLFIIISDTRQEQLASSLLDVFRKPIKEIKYLAVFQMRGRD